MVGELPRVGIYRDAEVLPLLGADEFLGSADRWHEALVAARPPPEEQVRAILEKSLKEQELGILGSWHAKEYFGGQVRSRALAGPAEVRRVPGRPRVLARHWQRPIL